MSKNIRLAKSLAGVVCALALTSSARGGGGETRAGQRED